MEIEVGEYVRIRGEIARITHKYKIDNHYSYTAKYTDGKEYCNTCINKIANHNKDIKKLIEIDDVVKVKDHDWIRIFNIDDEDILESFIEDCNENNWTLLSIVTHEQFENIEYKVETEEK